MSFAQLENGVHETLMYSFLTLMYITLMYST